MNIKTIEYSPEFGPNPLTEEMRKTLSSKSVEEQLDYFVVLEDELTEEFSYGDSFGEDSKMRIIPLRKIFIPNGYEPKLRGLILCEGIIVGAVFKINTTFRYPEIFKLLDEWVYAYTCSDDDGTGSTSCDVYRMLVYTGKIY